MSGAVRDVVATRFDATDRTADYQRLFGALARIEAAATEASRSCYYGSRLDKPWIPNPAVRLDSIGDVPPVIETAKTPRRPARDSSIAVPAPRLRPSAVGQSAADDAVFVHASASSAARRSTGYYLHRFLDAHAVPDHGPRARSADRLVHEALRSARAPRGHLRHRARLRADVSLRLRARRVADSRRDLRLRAAAERAPALSRARPLSRRRRSGSWPPWRGDPGVDGRDCCR